MTTKQIIQTIPQQYMPRYINGLISISIPYSVYFRPAEAEIKELKLTIEITIGNSCIQLFKDSFSPVVGVFK